MPTLSALQIKMLDTAFTIDPRMVVAIFKGAVQFCDFTTIDYVMEHYAEKMPLELRMELAVALMGLLARAASGEISVVNDIGDNVEEVVAQLPAVLANEAIMKAMLH